MGLLDRLVNRPLVALASALLLASSTIVTLPARAAGPGVSVQPPEATVSPSAQATVTIELMAPPQGVGAWTVDTTFDQGVLTAAACTTSSLPGSLATCNKDYAANKVRVTGVHPSGLTGTQTLAQITFNAIGAAGASSALTPVLVTFVDPQGHPLSGEVTAGRITITGGGGGTPSATLTPTPAATPSPPAPTSGGGGSSPTPTHTPTATSSATPTATVPPADGTPTPTPGGPAPAQATIDGSTGGRVATQGEVVAVTLLPGSFSGTALVSLSSVSPRSGQITAVRLGGLLGLLREWWQRLTGLFGSSSGQLAQEGLYREPDGFLFTDRAFRLSVTVNGQALERFNRPVSIAVRPQAGDIDKAGGNAEALRILQNNGQAQGWAPLPVEGSPFVGSQTGMLKASAERPGFFALAADLPEPSVVNPVGQAVASDYAPLLTWRPAGGTLQHHLQVLPAANPFSGQPDGPGINLIISDPADVARGSFQVQAPQAGAGNYVILPGMGYSWRVRTSSADFALGENDPQWSGWAAGAFRTPPPSSAGLSPVSPTPRTAAGSLAPTLTWTDTNPRAFYYEVQLSSDPTFTTDPSLATASVFWELLHGGLTTPLNSYRVRQAFPLQPRTAYHWRVRPRVQGDGAPVAWSDPWSFTTP